MANSLAKLVVSEKDIRINETKALRVYYPILTC